MKKRESNKYILKNPIALKDYQPNDNMTFNVVLKLIKKENNILYVEEIECESIQDAHKKIKQIKESGVRVKIYNEHRHLVHSETVNYIVEHGNTPDYA
jgi:hypothetical protein